MRTRAGPQPPMRHGGAPGAHRSLGRSFAAIARYESDSQIDQQKPGQQHMTAPRLALAYALDLLLGDPEWFPHPVRGLGYLVSRGGRWLRFFARGPRPQFVAGRIL